LAGTFNGNRGFLPIALLQIEDGAIPKCAAARGYPVDGAGLTIVKTHNHKLPIFRQHLSRLDRYQFHKSIQNHLFLMAEPPLPK
jgi:hypothetical protein